MFGTASTTIIFLLFSPIIIDPGDEVMVMFVLTPCIPGDEEIVMLSMTVGDGCPVTR